METHVFTKGQTWTQHFPTTDTDHFYAFSLQHAENQKTWYYDAIERMGHTKRPLCIHHHRSTTPCDQHPHTILTPTKP